ncbi:MAG TPA: C4-dicarboxylate ABC transporter, partial [Novosphingobium sp.]|nr:C4-dicarboxylate ABC transporter [Novosphingobium sp.]
MSEVADEIPDLAEETASPRATSRRRRWLAYVGAALVLGLGGVWLVRERLANRIIADQLESYGLPGKYEIEKIGVGRQVLRKVVIGDPARPDFTADEVTIETDLALGLPTFGRITLVRPRLYGSYTKGKLSFGALDKVFFAKSERPPGL